MDKVSVFESSDFGELRIIVDPKGDVWFVASDVAKSLGYVNAKDAIKRHVDNDDSMLLQVSDNQWGVNQSLLKTRYIDSIRIINESGLYSLDRINQQTIYMTGAGYEVTLNGIKGKLKNVFLKYGKFA